MQIWLPGDFVPDESGLFRIIFENETHENFQTEIRPAKNLRHLCRHFLCVSLWPKFSDDFFFRKLAKFFTCKHFKPWKFRSGYTHVFMPSIVLSTAECPVFYSGHMLILIKRSALVRNVIEAVSRNGRSLLLTGLTRLSYVERRRMIRLKGWRSIYTHIYNHTYIHTYKHIYTYTHICMCVYRRTRNCALCR